jgi:UDP-N-acetylmuramoyl-L-alanyl-D-glutamate--2,6-diaminopimelate ligase
MLLRDVLARVAVAEWSGDPGAEIADLTYDSRKAGAGTLFFCTVGEHADGHDFAAAAVERGAAGLVVERPLADLDVPQAVVADARQAMAPAAVAFNRDPTATLRVVGITGTNGKTTTAFLIRHLLEAGGSSCGLLGTVKKVVGGVESEVERTTPEAIDLQATFRAMLDAGDTACAMEVSSHALELGRVAGVHFAAAAFTNLTQDHLDFHADMDEYFAAKAKLFAEREGERAGAAVVNLDDPRGAELADSLRDAYGERLITFSADGSPQAALRATNVEFDGSGSRFTADGPFGSVSVSTAMPGHFNVANSLTALGVATSLGVDAGHAAEALSSAELVPGRMEPVLEGQDFAVLVDYAHTPDSLDNVLQAARKLTEGRLICVFGCGGDRDRAKRPLMGEIGARLSDVAVVTSDNPRSEDPEAIVAEVATGIPVDATDVRLEVDRREAIRLALTEAAAGDIVVIAGKGHEQGQEFERGRKLPFDDRQVAREELQRLQRTSAGS